MMLSSRTVPSVKDTHFRHTVLTKVNGPPSYETIKHLHDEVKANAASVPTTLGGGLYGHLGMILSATKFNALPNVAPWVTPVHPGPFAPPAGGPTGAQIEAAKDVWRERQYTFELYQATEKALIAQIVEAIDPSYIRPLLNRATLQYTDGVTAIMEHLYATHGRLTPQLVIAKEQALCNMGYSITMPVDDVFDAIEDLEELAEHAKSPLSTEHKLDLAYTLFMKEPIFHPDMRIWSRKPAADKTWDNMLTHLRDAHQDLCILPTAGDIFHQNNAHQANSTQGMVDLITQRVLDAFVVVPPDAADTPTIPATDVANAAMQQRETSVSTREAALLAQMQQMMASFNTPNQRRNNRRGTNTNGNGNSNNTNNNGNSNNNNRSNAGASNRNPLPRNYCWSHGVCAHGSATCNRQAPGHQITASFTNMQGGSTRNCFWLPPPA
jgi:hypothetical protein